MAKRVVHEHLEVGSRHCAAGPRDRIQNVLVARAAAPINHKQSLRAELRISARRLSPPDRPRPARITETGMSAWTCTFSSSLVRQSRFHGRDTEGASEDDRDPPVQHAPSGPVPYGGEAHEGVRPGDVRNRHGPDLVGPRDGTAPKVIRGSMPGAVAAVGARLRGHSAAIPMWSIKVPIRRRPTPG